MRVYFFLQHVRDTVIIMEEGTLPHPQCPRCNMLMTWRALNFSTAQCAKEEDRKRQRMAEEEIQESEDRAFQAYGRPLMTITSFKYLGWLLTAADDNWPALVGGLIKAWKGWAQLARIMGW